MDKMFGRIAVGLVLLSSTLADAKEVLIPTVLPEPSLTTMRITPQGEVVQIGFADDSVIDNPEIDIQSLRDIDIVQVYMLPFDLWFIETAASNDDPLCHWWLSWGCKFLSDQDFVFYFDQNGQPNKVTDVEGKELPVEWDLFARLDGGKADVLGHRTFTMVDYRTSPDGEMQRRILKDPAMTAQ
jgi:hypothetical protein